MIFSFYSKAERNGEIRLGQNKILHLWCGSLQGSLHGWQRRLQTALMPSPFSSPCSLAVVSPPPPPPPPVPCLAIRFLSVHQCSGRGEKRGGGGLFWSMAGNQTMGREDVKQIGPITYLPTRIPQSHLSLHLFLAPFCVPICNTQKCTPT